MCVFVLRRLKLEDSRDQTMTCERLQRQLPVSASWKEPHPKCHIRSPRLNCSLK